jgi:hypothetical protein
LPTLPMRLGAGPASYADMLLASHVPARLENENVAQWSRTSFPVSLSTEDLIRPFLARISALAGKR